MLPFFFLMGSTLVVSTVMVICASSWVSMWVAFEVNTLSFMPLMKSKGASKYFLAQSLGSALILSGPALNSDSLVLFGAMVKAGVAPFHIWFPQVMECLSWSLCLILSTWQKISPIVVVFSTCGTSFVYVFAASSLMMGAFGALKQTRLRSILAYSSITHMGWVLCGAMISLSVGLVYFLTYCITSVFLFMKLSKSNMKGAVSKDLSFVLILFSMSGLPPFVGFFPKMWVFFDSPFFMTPFLVVSSVIMIFVYTSIMFSSLGNMVDKLSGTSLFFIGLSCCMFI